MYRVCVSRDVYVRTSVSSLPACVSWQAGLEGKVGIGRVGRWVGIRVAMGLLAHVQSRPRQASAI